MAENLERERSRSAGIDVGDVPRDRPFTDLLMEAVLEPVEETASVAGEIVGGGESFATTESAPGMPTWLRGFAPVNCPSDDAKKLTVSKGSNCCLFYPLGYCRNMDVINGFCVFHLISIFNLVYQTDATYVINEASGRPATNKRHACFVYVPQRIDDQYTPVFPVPELFPTEIQISDIKLYNLAKYLQLYGVQNWEHVYANHVNYLYRLFLVFSPNKATTTGCEARDDQMTDMQIMMYWKMWNDYYSAVLAANKTNLSVFRVSESRASLVPLVLNECSTVTQLIGRLFTKSYTSLNAGRFFAAPANYGIFSRNHWSYANNLCSIGTSCTKGGVPCIGNTATLNVVGYDNEACSRETIHHTKVNDCMATLCVPSKLNLDSPGLNNTVVTTVKTA